MVPWNLDKRFATSFEKSSTNVKSERNGKSDDTYKDPIDVRNGIIGDDTDDKPSTKVQERVVVQRYCHMFKQGELESLVELSGIAKVETSYYDESNWAVVLRRVR
ncbi:hypothetical protein DD238_006539 [Peronospora effusa]|nr:hypothetical protein DD238_006539 [Peronospora effusa]